MAMTSSFQQRTWVWTVSAQGSVARCTLWHWLQRVFLIDIVSFCKSFIQKSQIVCSSTFWICQDAPSNWRVQIFCLRHLQKLMGSNLSSERRKLTTKLDTFNLASFMCTLLMCKLPPTHLWLNQATHPKEAIDSVLTTDTSQGILCCYFHSWPMCFSSFMGNPTILSLTQTHDFFWRVQSWVIHTRKIVLPKCEICGCGLHSVLQCPDIHPQDEHQDGIHELSSNSSSCTIFALINLPYALSLTSIWISRWWLIVSYNSCWVD